MLFTYLIRAYRWRAMLRPYKDSVPIWPVFSATCIGFTAVTLFGRPGELVRPYLISVRERVPFSSQLAAWLLERIYDLLMVLLIFGYALAHMPADTSRVGPAIQWAMRTGGYVAALAGLLCVSILVATTVFSEQARRRLSDALAFLPPKAHAKAEGIVLAFTTGMSCTRGPRQVLVLLGWSVAEWSMIAAATLALFQSFPGTMGLGWIEAFIFLGFVAFGSIVQIPGIGGGLQVAAVVVLTQLFGLTLERASGFAILFWVIGFVLVVPAGLALMFIEGVKLRALRDISTTSLERETAAP